MRASPRGSMRRKGRLFGGFSNSPKRFLSKNNLREVSGPVTLERPERKHWPGPKRQAGGGPFRRAGIRFDWKSGSSSIRPRHFAPPLAKILSKIDLGQVPGAAMRAPPRGSMRRKAGFLEGFRIRRRGFFRKTTSGRYPDPSLRPKDRRGGGFSMGWNPARLEIELLEYPAPSLRPALSENPLENGPRSGPRGRDEGSSPRADEAKRQAFWRVFEFAEEVSFEKRLPGGIRARHPGETRAKTLARAEKTGGGGAPFHGLESGSTGNRTFRVSGPVTSPRP